MSRKTKKLARIQVDLWIYGFSTSLQDAIIYGENHEVRVICGIWNFPEILLDTAFTMVQNRGNYHQRRGVP
jgi:hypothetical protein